uniref:PPM-type phosphatase domain-containing protein n=1 Tax=Pseudo-nitzschia australis TaxID=44445 RepID=A0A7S4EFC8_9STRA|mmetsp:Transcript_20400/g.44382  ORF Transcript_20400/g.44382 Transcript_20400/m.44382 type:complete len:504 (+) Transcript_20400:78-1589(+)|eukprot:CAMPEP_0168212944 /NCGR_PEP_ID=MMETSP0140_2-20121125/4534_1 /TAXON_ID=44445 /ORGANISM="Pseudo-nitzschia australis, Strain 10249 10 AB" /LENGTH=503 /DNA_ID=CAMNT_0008139767 /DNA_START=81 /DNA_END=1592 /DNA_ORIENTATION=-
MTISDAEETSVNNDKTEEKGKTFRKRRLSLTNLRELDDEGENPGDEVHISIDSALQQEEQEDKAHTFRKRRLSLTQNEEIDSAHPSKRPRKASDASASSVESTRSCNNVNNNINLESKILHAAEISSPASPRNSSSLPEFYQKAARPLLALNDECEHKTPKWKKRHIRPHAEDDKSLPFPRDIVGTFSCHGVEPIYDDNVIYHSLEDEDDSTENQSGLSIIKPTMAAKTNQDRGGVAFPYGNCNRTALFAVYDGHGQGGELVSQYSLHEIQQLLERHPDFNRNIEKAFKETFLRVDSSLKDECLIEPMYAGTTACVALLRDKKLVLSNAGDSRAVLARNVEGNGGGCWEAIDLTVDQNPDLPAEQERIESMGGYVTPAPEPGLSSRVWLDKECSQIGLAMARSIGDHAVKSIGVIAEPVVSFHDVRENDDFLVLATDGVWEFISSAEAVKIVAKHLHKGATKACQILIETAAEKWHDEEGDYRDDITAFVIRLQHLLEPTGSK